MEFAKLKHLKKIHCFTVSSHPTMGIYKCLPNIDRIHSNSELLKFNALFSIKHFHAIFSFLNRFKEQLMHVYEYTITLSFLNHSKKI